MTQWELYLKNAYAHTEESKELLETIKIKLSLISETQENWYEEGEKFLVSIMRDLILTPESEKLGDALRDGIIEDIPIRTVTDYLEELIFHLVARVKRNTQIDPIELMFQPIFSVDFPDIFRSIYNNLVATVGKDREENKKILESVRVRAEGWVIPLVEIKQ